MNYQLFEFNLWDSKNALKLPLPCHAMPCYHTNMQITMVDMAHVFLYDYNADIACY